MVLGAALIGKTGNKCCTYFQFIDIGTTTNYDELITVINKSSTEDINDEVPKKTSKDKKYFYTLISR